MVAQYLHVSRTFKREERNGKEVIVQSTGETYNIGRNKQKRATRRAAELKRRATKLFGPNPEA